MMCKPFCFPAAEANISENQTLVCSSLEQEVCQGLTDEIEEAAVLALLGEWAMLIDIER